jgi:hypothetical protein
VAVDVATKAQPSQAKDNVNMDKVKQVQSSSLQPPSEGMSAPEVIEVITWL